MQLAGKLVGEIPLFLQRGGDLAPALVQAAQVLQALVNLAQQLVVQRPGLLLAVAGDKGNGVAVVNQAQYVFALLGFQVKLLTKGLNNIHRMHPFRIQSKKAHPIITRPGGLRYTNACICDMIGLLRLFAG